MAIISSLYILFSSTASAGWWHNWCERYLVANDPYQFERVSTEWLIKEVRWLESSRELTSQDESMLKIMRDELTSRGVGR